MGIEARVGPGMRGVARLCIAATAATFVFAGDCGDPRSPNPAATPAWQELGPTAIHHGQVEGIENRPAIGAINAIAPHPTDAQILFVGSVNGGIWRTESALSGRPRWEPLTDDMESLSISAILFDPLDSSANTLYAALGNRSSYGVSGPMLGVMRSVDGGDTWEHRPSVDLIGTSIRDLVALPISPGPRNEPVLLAGTPNGVYRSDDGGDTFVQTWPPAAASGSLHIHSLVAAPGEPQTAYAGVIGNTWGLEVARTDDGGLNWSVLSHNHEVREPTAIRLATGGTAPGKPAPLYKAYAGRGERLPDGQVLDDSRVWVYRSADRGQTWESMFMPLVPGPDGQVGPVPGGQVNVHFSMLADPTKTNVVYIGGDRQATGGMGQLFRGTYGSPPAAIWQSIVGAGASGTTPHADSRRIAFDAVGNLLEVDDGGIYRLAAPTYSQWDSLNGDLRITEFFSIAWDAHNDTAIGGTQDNGVVEQMASIPAGSVVPWRCARLFGLGPADIITATGDGGYVAVDARSNPDFSVRFMLGNNEHVFFRRNFGSPNDNIVPTWLSFLPTAPAPPSPIPFSGLAPPDDALDFSGLRLSPFDLNALDGERLAFGLTNLYLSEDSGVTVALVPPPAMPENVASRRIGAIEYGGMAAGPPAIDALVWSKGNLLFERASPQATTTSRLIGAASFNATRLAIRDIEFDPTNWTRTYLVTEQQVFAVRGLGTPTEQVVDITGNLAAINTNLLSLSNTQKSIGLTRLELVPDPTSDGEELIAVVSAMGGVYRLQGARAALDGAPAQWLNFGDALPNVQVMDIDYDAEDDVLVAATAGRGAWLVPKASGALAEPLLVPAVE